MSEQADPAQPAPEVEGGTPSWVPADAPVAPPAPEPTPVVTPGDATAAHPPGTARPLHAPPTPIGEERPEVLVGAAFGGGVLAAMLLKGLARRRRR